MLLPLSISISKNWKIIFSFQMLSGTCFFQWNRIQKYDIKKQLLMSRTQLWVLSQINGNIYSHHNKEVDTKNYHSHLQLIIYHNRSKYRTQAYQMDKIE
ncbi:unnamed protein product [Paramecium pentaurelia]|uniref:Uncharacterized protein n=1 Tax=Paramecium pentaurelia TaxID=43138 RepID=A0A8S1YIX5_9CILI|nr:unnamed protein product [Paramecium pentaurelia]